MREQPTLLLFSSLRRITMEETHTFPESKVRAEFINTSVAVDMVKLTKDGAVMVLTAEDAMTIALTLLDRKNQNLATPPIRLE